MATVVSNNQTGFTLLEVVIVISIMTIVTYAVLTALPVARTNQQLTGDITALRSILTNAQQQAVNEIRSPDCLATVPSDADSQRRCSNIGVFIADNKVIQFADTSPDRIYTPGVDYILRESDQASGLKGGPDITILFEADPPTVVTYANGQVLGPKQKVSFTLAIKDTQRALTIGPYGIIENATK